MMVIHPPAPSGLWVQAGSSCLSWTDPSADARATTQPGAAGPCGSDRAPQMGPLPGERTLLMRPASEGSGAESKSVEVTTLIHLDARPWASV